MDHSLLPSNATRHEKALEAAFASVLDKPVLIKHIWDPYKCPVPLLPWLAKCLSVDEWSSTWPVDVQRQAIAESVPTHLKKGTAGAVKKALETLNASVGLSQWFEHDGVPFTARLIAYTNDNLNTSGTTLLTPELQAHLWRVIAATRPRRTQIEFGIAALQEQTMHVAATGTSYDILSSNIDTWADHPTEPAVLTVTGAGTVNDILQDTSQSYVDAPTKPAEAFITGTGSASDILQTESQSYTDQPAQDAELFMCATGQVHDVCETRHICVQDSISSSELFMTATGGVTEINFIKMEAS